MEKNLDFESRYWLFGSDRESLQAEYTEKLRLLNALPKTDWHAGFGAATDMMVFGMDDVVVVPEYELGGAPPRADFLFISNGDKPLQGDVFKHFKKFNVLEYKRPDDPINMRVIHKVLGYANFLIGFQERADEVLENEVTVAIFRATKNEDLFKSLESTGALVKGDASGVYFLTKEVSNLPFQIVITSELEGDENRYWRALAEQTSVVDFEQILNEVREFKDDLQKERGRFFLQLIILKNPKLGDVIGKDGKMHSVLLDIVKKDVDEMLEAERKAAREAEREAERKAFAKNIKNLAQTLGYTVERVMEAMAIPEDEREEYAALVAAM
jgi:hypothetical protein